MPILAVLLAVAALFSAPAHAEALLSATELNLPRYHAAALEADAPAPEILFDDDGSLWVLGRTSLWRWRIETRKLSRMRLHDPKADGSSLVALATDGISLYASSHRMVYQVIPSEGRVFRYPKVAATVKPKRAPRFVGRGDDFWWVTETGLYKLDRYGKTLLARDGAAGVGKGGSAVLAAEGTLLWSDGKRLLRAAPGDATAKPRVAYAAKQPILDVRSAGGHLIAHTAHAVLRLTPEGKLAQSIPVEGRRKLLRMALDDDRHAYLFSDQLLEVYRLSSKTATRYALPLDDSETIGPLLVKDDLAAVVADGSVRLFRLGAAVKR